MREWTCLGADASSIYSIFPTNVSKAGFTLNVRTWGQAHMLSSSIEWLALVSEVSPMPMRTHAAPPAWPLSFHGHAEAVMAMPWARACPGVHVAACMLMLSRPTQGLRSAGM